MMKIAIIGCGNMGGAIARALADSNDYGKKYSLVAANRTDGKLHKLCEEFPGMATTTDNKTAVSETGLVILAVKPWLFDDVAAEILPALRKDCIVVSVIAGVTLDRMQQTFATDRNTRPIFRLIPNTALTVGESMTVIAHRHASEEIVDCVEGLFAKAGETMIIEERLMEAATALGSCGTAFAMRYMRAAMEAGIEMGLYPAQARKIAAQTVKGAAELILRGSLHPEEEIDKVTTPGGITIKGLNRMEACGFTNAVIEGHKACKQ